MSVYQTSTGRTGDSESSGIESERADSTSACISRVATGSLAAWLSLGGLILMSASCNNDEAYSAFHGYWEACRHDLSPADLRPHSELFRCGKGPEV